MIQPVLQPQQPPKRQILTVSQLNNRVKGVLENQIASIWLTGEISNLTKAASGHWYFSLKDDAAQIRCAMFRFKTQSLRFSPSEGDKVVVKGKVSLYEARGDYQLIADYMEPAGVGALQQKLNQLINKLKALGLFSQEHKQPLPKLPVRIGVITSPNGAAIHDVLTVLQRRCPMIPVVIYPTQVQGESGAASIIKALQSAQKRNECDVLLITRGGGSLEDLWCFNDEQLAQKIFDCKIPIVAAIGHEVDTTIAELVADLRAPTPSAAAELLAPDQQALQQRLDLLSMRLSGVLFNQIDQLQNRLNIARLKVTDPESSILASQIKLEKLQHRFSISAQSSLQNKEAQLRELKHRLQNLSPITQLENNQHKVNEIKLRLNTAWQKIFSRLDQNLKLAAGSLDTLSPLSTLSRGYSIARQTNTGKVINRTAQLKPGEKFTLMVSDGQADCQVSKLIDNN